MALEARLDLRGRLVGGERGDLRLGIAGVRVMVEVGEER